MAIKVTMTSSMRCIFCKRDSAGSRSVEHIIPESLGNTTALLRAGIVCDKCNNYFAQNVEKPFLEAEALRALRFHRALPSKKGRIPPLAALLLPEYPVTIYRNVKEGKFAGVIDVESEGARHLLSAREARILFPPHKVAPEHSTVSRFLAKVGIEAMAQRVVDMPGGIEYLTDEKQLDLIRRFAREGFPKQWPQWRAESMTQIAVSRTPPARRSRQFGNMTSL